MSPSTGSEEISPPVETNVRQRPGAACDECRRRKLRCDGQQPQCSVCRETGVVCQVTERGLRGPKKGHLKALKNRISHLEAMLASRLPAQQLPQGSQSNNRNIEELTPLATPKEAADTASVATTDSPLHRVTLNPAFDHESVLTNGFPSVWGSASHEGSLPSTFSLVSSIPIPLTDNLGAELDQLYLDRVHHSIPILHQRRFLEWSKSSTKTASQRCLQYAMWTLAALLSSQFREAIEPLYHKTKQMLESLSVEGNGYSNVSTELAQAWVLVVIFESMRTYHRQAWMSAGRAFRLVQAMRYHEIDRPADKRGPLAPRCDDTIEVEERRRVFWMAYFLDHVISMRDDWPITLNEHVICTRLPAPDGEFQSGEYDLGPFLSEAMTEPTLKTRSSFNECLIFATICGRCLLQSQRHHISKAYGDMSLDWTEQLRSLEALLTTRLQALERYYPSPTEFHDPLLLFANIIGQATVIYFCKVMKGSTGESADLFQWSSELYTYHRRALEASGAIIRLAATLRDLPFSKIHPLMPIPLFLCAEFLYENVHLGESFQLRARELFLILRDLRNINHHEQSYLDLLPQSCVSKTSELFGLNVENSIPTNI